MLRLAPANRSRRTKHCASSRDLSCTPNPPTLPAMTRLGKSSVGFLFVVLVALLACKEGEGSSDESSSGATDVPHPKGAKCKGLKDEKECSTCCSKCCADGPMGMSAGTFSPDQGCECRKRW